MSSSFDLDGKVAVVTGASSGLGERFCQVLDRCGAKVALVARRGDRLQQVASELNDALVIEADITHPESSTAIVQKTVDRYGAINIVVNNAGVSDSGATTDVSDQRFRHVLDVNLISAFALARDAARHMITANTNGSIINISSIWGIVGVGQIPDAAYAASKAGIIGMTRELAAEWAREGVRVNALAPGWFPSEMTAGKMFGDSKAEKWIASRTPMGRPGRVEELDGALIFLASDASSFVTGITIPVDGGWTSI